MLDSEDGEDANADNDLDDNVEEAENGDKVADGEDEDNGNADLMPIRKTMRTATPTRKVTWTATLTKTAMRSKRRLKRQLWRQLRTRWRAKTRRAETEKKNVAISVGQEPATLLFVSSAG